MKKGEEDP